MDAVFNSQADRRACGAPSPRWVRWPPAWPRGLPNGCGSPRPGLRSRRRHEPLLARGTALKVTVDGRHVAAWSFGTGKVVALMHGWGGHAGQLVPMIDPLVKAGFRVVTFDALAHGSSAGSAAGVRLSTFFDFAAGLAALRCES